MKTLLTTILLVISLGALKAPEVILDMRNYDNWIKEYEFYNSEFSIELFYKALKHQGIKNPEIVLRQAILETGWFKSKLFIKHNNPFGMKYAKVRKNCCKAGTKEYSGYSHWYDAVKDYKHWQERYKINYTDSNKYYTFLDKLPYASSKTYIKTLKSISIPFHVN